MRRGGRFATLAAGLAALSGCHKGPGGGQTGGEAPIVDIPQTVVPEAPGTTPMKDRVAVIGLLNKRNGLSRDLVMKPGQAFRVKDVIVRLRACETTAPWEAQKLTGAFVQVDVRDTHGDFRRRLLGLALQGDAVAQRRRAPGLRRLAQELRDDASRGRRVHRPGGIGGEQPVERPEFRAFPRAPAPPRRLPRRRPRRRPPRPTTRHSPRWLISTAPRLRDARS
jgi:hypothetical protein